MRIVDVVCAKGRTGFFFDDQRAIKRHAIPDGGAYKGDPVTPGFHSVRQAGDSVAVMLVLEDGQIARGDCAAVQYSGAGGRDPLFLAADYIPIIEQEIAPRLCGQQLSEFGHLAFMVEGLEHGDNRGKHHTAVRYGVSQALLDGVAKATNRLMVEVLAEEYGTRIAETEIPIFTQSGDNRYENADKMILKGADVLPHGLVNHVPTKLGRHGELLLEYVRWLRERVCQLRPASDYQPILHLDVYGNLGLAFANDHNRILEYLATLEQAALPLQLRIEGPVDEEEREQQVESLGKLTAAVDSKGLTVQIVADEWCNTLADIQFFADNKAGHMIQIKTPDLGGIQNTVEAVLYCRQRGIGAYLGGTCNETDISAQVCVHVAMATQPCQMLAKPGMGVDEGYMVVYNEMQRILALRRSRSRRSLLNARRFVHE